MVVPLVRAIATAAAGATCLSSILLLDLRYVDHPDLLEHGVFDEAAHLLTAGMIAIALGAIRVPVRVAALLLGSIAIDIDHIPLILGMTDAPAGTSRPESHSLIPVIVLLLGAALDRRHRATWSSAALGVAAHLFRDLGTGTVLLGWPVSDRPIGISYESYIWGAMVLIPAAVCRTMFRHSTSRAPTVSSTAAGCT